MENNSVSIEEFHIEIDLIHACISHMAQNSFIFWIRITIKSYFFLRKLK